MTYIYESPDKSKTIYKREFNNYKKREKITMEMISLFDYLGRKAGPELGLKVATAAGKAGVMTETRKLNHKGWDGNVNLYPKTFLDLYFKNNLNEGSSGKQLLKG
jgi:hypothetical protein